MELEFWQSVIVWLHLLLFVYWLGGDIGVFYTSYFRNNPKYDVPTRILLARITGDIDMAPKTTMVLMVPTGFTVAAIHGYLTISSTWLIAFWIFGAVWLALVWWLHLEKSPEKKAPWAKFDLRLRWALMITFAVLAISSFTTGEPINVNFVALKLLIFAATIGCGIGIRVSIKPYVAAFAEIKAEGSTPEREARLNAAAKRSRNFVKGIWVLVALAAFIGTWKPGF
jgi:hypothetical protein